MAGVPGADETGPGDDLDTEAEDFPDEDAEAEGEGDDAEDAGDDAEAEGDADADAGDAEGQGAQGQARHVAPQRRASREDNLRAEFERKLANEREAFNRQLAEVVAQQRQPSQAELARQAEEERQRVELMSPAEVAAYYAQKTERTITERLNQQQAMLFDRADRSEFEALVERDPTLRKFSDKVEEYRRQAPGVPRRLLLATAIGEQALAQRGSARTRATTRNEAARARQVTRPTNGRSDVPSDRGQRSNSLDARLRTMTI